MRTSPRFWNLIAKYYAAKPVPDEAIYKKKCEATQRYFSDQTQVLEFGCGTGSTALLHAPHVAHYLAVDTAKSMLEIAREKVANTDINNLSFELNSLEEFTSEKKFDVVLALSLLHLLPEPDQALEKISQLLVPNGVFVSSTACVLDAMPWFRFIAPIGSTLRLMPYVNCFSRHDLIQMLEKHGFSIEFELEKTAPEQACFLIAKKSNVSTPGG